LTKNKKGFIKMRRFFTVIILCALFYSCKPGIPKDIIQPNKMENVLYDIHVIDGYSATLSFPNMDSAKKVIAPFYKGVYKKHGIDSALYNRSLDYYYKNPKLMKLMYDHVTEKLIKAKDKAAPKAIPEVPKVDSAKVKDSIKLASKAVAVKPIAVKLDTVKAVKLKAVKTKTPARLKVIKAKKANK